MFLDGGGTREEEHASELANERWGGLFQEKASWAVWRVTVL